jgi:hypothetical protein
VVLDVVFGILFGMFFSTLFSTTIAKYWIATFASSLAMTEGETQMLRRLSMTKRGAFSMTMGGLRLCMTQEGQKTGQADKLNRFLFAQER